MSINYFLKSESRRKELNFLKMAPELMTRDYILKCSGDPNSRHLEVQFWNGSGELKRDK
jgi:hypothetical protein